MEITAYVAHAFCKNDRGGNPAGVVFDSKLTIHEKILIAKTLGYAETAYISGSLIADYRLTYFTPKEEVDLCGHATIAAFKVLMQLNMLSQTNYTIETKRGILSITIKNDEIFMEQNQPEFYEVITPNEFIDCFNISAIDTLYPIQIVSTGLRDILVPIKGLAQLHNLMPNFEHIKKISARYNTIGMHLYALHDDQLTCRNFAPLYDINEEAATGTSNAALACFLHQNYDSKKSFYRIEQGYSLNAPSEILVKLATDPYKKIEKVYVGGKAYCTETKIIDLPAIN